MLSRMVVPIIGAPMTAAALIGGGFACIGAYLKSKKD